MMSTLSRLERSRLSDVDVSPAVWGVLEVPASRKPSPGVILLTGSSGWQTAYAEIAKLLSGSGFATLALDYLAETGREPSAEDRTRDWLRWEATVRNGISCLQESQHVSRVAIGLVGYSLGAYLAIAVASELPEVRAVVEFFGGGGAGPKTIEEQVRKLPPLLILHGEADSVVPVTLGYELRDAARAQGRHVEMHVYPGAEHGFNAPWSPNYSEPESSDSLARSVQFLTRWLGI